MRKRLVLAVLNQVTGCCFRQQIFAPVAFPVSHCVLDFLVALTLIGNMRLQYKPRIRYFYAKNSYVHTWRYEVCARREMWQKTSYSLLPPSTKHASVAFPLSRTLRSFIFVRTFGGMLLYYLYCNLQFVCEKLVCPHLGDTRIAHDARCGRKPRMSQKSLFAKQYYISHNQYNNCH